MRTGLRRGLAPLAVLAGMAVGVAWLYVGYVRARGASLHTVTVGAAPGYVAVDTRTGRAFVTNSTSNSVSLLTAAGVETTATVGATPLPVAVATGANRAFVLNVSGHSVSVLDATTGRVLRTVPLPYPIDAAVDDAAGHVFVLHGGCGTAYRVAMFDARSGRILHTAALASAPLGLTIDARVRRVLIAESGNNTVTLLDTVSGRVVRTVAVGAIPGAVALDSAHDRAFVTNRGDNTVSVLDARRGALLWTVAVGQNPTSVAVDSRTARVFVLNAGAGTVSVLDARTGRRLRTVSVEPERVQGLSTASNPVDLVVDMRQGRIFVLNGSSLTHAPTRGSVSVLDATSGAVRRTIPVGFFPQGEALDEAGARLFVVNQMGDAPRGGTPSWGWLPQQVRPWLRLLAPSPSSGASGTVSVLDTSDL